MKRMTISGAQKLIWFTWLGILSSGLIVYFAVNPVIWYLLVVVGFLLLYSLINFWAKFRKIPVDGDIVMPTLFGPTAFFAAVATFASAVLSGVGMCSPLALSFATVCAACILAVYPESRYTGGWCLFFFWNLSHYYVADFFMDIGINLCT